MENTWKIHKYELYTGIIWVIHRNSKGYTWEFNGLYMRIQWVIHGDSMDYTWKFNEMDIKLLVQYSQRGTINQAINFPWICLLVDCGMQIYFAL